MAVFSSIGSGNGIEDSQAREQAKAAVRAAMKLPPVHFLKAVRREDLEEELFSFQVKIKGKIAEYAYLYEATETGYEIVSPDEVIVHSSVEGSRKWYIAVSRQTGTVYGLLGFQDSSEGFNRLARDASVRIEDEAQAKNYTGLYWRCVLGGDYGTVVNDPHDLKRQVDDAVYGYRVTTNGKVSVERWWKGFEASGVKPQFGVQVAKAGGTYSITCSSLIVPVSKVPVIQGLAFRVAENGTVSPVQVRKLYPKTVAGGEPQQNR
jgi:hypothetical protein